MALHITVQDTETGHTYAATFNGWDLDEDRATPGDTRERGVVCVRNQQGHGMFLIPVDRIVQKGEGTYGE